MSEEAENSGGGSLKTILLGLVSTIALGVGGYVTKQLTGESDEPAQAVTAPAPVINITQNQAQQASGGGGVKVVERVVEKPSAQHASAPAPAPKPKKKEGDEFKEEAPKW